MTDERLIVASAAQVMKWKTRVAKSGATLAADGFGSSLCLTGNSILRRWNPLDSDMDAFEMVDALREATSGFSLQRTGDNWSASFAGFPGCSSIERRRAIVIACLTVVEADFV